MTAAQTPWGRLCELVALWDATGAPPPHRDPTTYDTWDDLRRTVERALGPQSARRRLSRTDLRVIADVVAADPMGMHAAAWALDIARWPTFSEAWIRGKTHHLATGDLYPIVDWDDDARRLVGRLPRPWLTQLRPDDFPHVRRHDSVMGDPDVIFDGNFFDELMFLADLRHVSALTVNAERDELLFPIEGFPVEAVDTAEQTRRALRGVEGELAGISGMIVLPELAVPQEALVPIAERVGSAERNVVVVAGSRHDPEPQRRNVATLLTSAGDSIEFEKREPVWSQAGREGIQPTPTPFRILVAGPVRLAVVICKDFLTERLVDMLARCGANLVAVPSLSNTTDLHDANASTLAYRSHTLSVIANGPLRNAAGERPGSAILGRPTPVRTIRADADEPVSSVQFDIVAGSVEIVSYPPATT